VGEIMTSVAKIVVKITSVDAAEGRRIVEFSSRKSKYDAEYREHAATGASGFTSGIRIG
jgi:hypothetical protein